MEYALSAAGRVFLGRQGWLWSYGGGRHRYYAPCYGLHSFNLCRLTNLLESEGKIWDLRRVIAIGSVPGTVVPIQKSA
jgi:hypothetical protein